MPAIRSHTPKGQSTREHIVAAAERLFATGGFHGTSTRDVAAAARLPLASLVYHFARKEQLYAAVLEGIGAELVAVIGELDFYDLVPVLVDWTLENPERLTLLVRELLDNPVRVATEGALWGAVTAQGFVCDAVIVSDDAGQIGRAHV